MKFTPNQKKECKEKKEKEIPPTLSFTHNNRHATLCVCVRLANQPRPDPRVSHTHARLRRWLLTTHIIETCLAAKLYNNV